MTTRHKAVESVIDTLLGETPRGAEVTLDRVGELVGARAFTFDEVDEVIAAVEKAGHRVTSPRTTAKADLQAVLSAARDIQRESHARPSVPAIAARTGLPADAVRQALSLGRIMGR
ncbi:MAG: hypothetical protein WCJ30_26360 [Deltaproteobacteria bacterium]